MNLPEEMPPLFASTYTPIAAAGTTAQIRHVARLLATQLTSVGIRTNREQQGEAPSAPDSSQVSLVLHELNQYYLEKFLNYALGLCFHMSRRKMKKQEMMSHLPFRLW